MTCASQQSLLGDKENFEGVVKMKASVIEGVVEMKASVTQEQPSGQKCVDVTLMAIDEAG